MNLPDIKCRWSVILKAVWFALTVALVVAHFWGQRSSSPPTLSVHPIERYCRMKAYQYANVIDGRIFDARMGEKMYEVCLNDKE